MRTSVCSVAGVPLAGSIWTKSVAGAAVLQNGSSRRPSSVTVWVSVSRTAATLRRAAGVG